MAKESLPYCSKHNVLKSQIKDPRKASGVALRCRLCANEQSRCCHQKNAERYNDRKRERYHSTDRIQEQTRARTAKWKAENKEKWAATKKLQCERKRARDHSMLLKDYRAYRAERKKPKRLTIDGLIVRKSLKRRCPILSAFPKIEYQVNRLERLAKAKEWSRNNPDKAYAKKLRRKMRLANVEDTLTIEQWEGIKQRYGYRCAYCGLRKKLTRDHVIPISKGGSNTVDNIVPACISCNCSKHTGPPPTPVQTMLFA